MEVSVKTDKEAFKVDLDQGIDLSIAIKKEGVKAWYVDPPKIEPVRGDGFVGAVDQGGSVNFFDIGFNPHGHGTHTECIGHITPQHETLDKLKHYHCTAVVLSIKPQVLEGGEIEVSEKGDLWISERQIQEALGGAKPKAVIVRTLPNTAEKKKLNYSNTNPCYFDPKALKWLADIGVDHLLVDLPSVDREHDNGLLLAHRAFWSQIKNENGSYRTITELIFVPDEAKDGWYWLNLMLSAFENDAVPSRPIIYPLKRIQ
ncbi:cyclase family protein [Luteibaculum oceani]|uniref:Cyclase family protein n=1 Tax=Luteibaculum oceani TaxID=1294296 RepID=A0A5C6VK56_9FLAO|nr:cyclase family protein [Luteibaculum oceani]